MRDDNYVHDTHQASDIKRCVHTWYDSRQHLAATSAAGLITLAWYYCVFPLLSASVKQLKHSTLIYKTESFLVVPLGQLFQDVEDIQ